MELKSPLIALINARLHGLHVAVQEGKTKLYYLFAEAHCLSMLAIMIHARASDLCVRYCSITFRILSHSLHSMDFPNLMWGVSP